MPVKNKVHQAANCPWVTLQKIGQSYRLSVSGTLFEDNKRRYISLLACRHNEAGLRKAHQYQQLIQDEIDSGAFDASLVKYEYLKNRVAYNPLEKMNLESLWEWWLTIKKTLLSEGTYKIKYAGTLYNAIKKTGSNLPLTEATSSKLLHYLERNLNSSDASKLFNELKKAYDRATELKLINGINPFIGYSEKILSKQKSKVNTDSISELLAKNNSKVAYTAIERDAIIEWFVINKSCYALYIYFKFYTGCRTGESVELRWCDVTENCETIFVRRSYVESIDKVKGTKTGQERRFNCSKELTQLLIALQLKRRKPQDSSELIFKSIYDTRIDMRRIGYLWDKAIRELVACGRIDTPLSQNHTRHTFSQLARENNDKLDVAVQLGHSAITADKHYSNRGSNTTVLSI